MFLFFLFPFMLYANRSVSASLGHYSPDWEEKDWAKNQMVIKAGERAIT